MTDPKEEEDKPFQCKKCPEKFTTEDRLQVHSHNHKLKVNTGKRVLLSDQTPTPTKFLDSNYDPFDTFADMRNNGGETPATSKPRLIISPTLHTPVANLVSPVFPTSLLTSSSSLQNQISASLDSPIFPVPKLSPVPGSLSFHKGVTSVPQIDLQTILKGGLQMAQNHIKKEPEGYVIRYEQMCYDMESHLHDAESRIPVLHANSPKDSRKQMIVDRIRKRVDIPPKSPDSEDLDMLDTKPFCDASMLSMTGGPGNPRKRFPSEINGQIDDKRRKFLERNRAAAQRCREKRKQWINNLQAEKFSVQEENNKLHTEVHNLRQEVAYLKCMLLQHKDCPVTKARKDGKLPDGLLHPPVFPIVTESGDIKKPSPTKPQPQHPIRLHPPRDPMSNGDMNGHIDIKPRITPTSSINSDPLGPLLEGLITKDGYSRSKFSPLFGPLTNLPRSPIIGLSPFSLGPNFPSLMSMGTSVEPQYTITSLDSRMDKNRGNKGKESSPGRQENPCPDVANGLAVLREALSKT